MVRSSINWIAIDSDPRFQRLHARKSAFLACLMILSLLFYFLLPIGAGYATELFKRKIFGAVNIGLLFALSQFLVAWGLAFYYAVRAQDFDEMAAELVRDAERIGAKLYDGPET